jgi:hypothetical protein
MKDYIRILGLLAASVLAPYASAGTLVESWESNSIINLGGNGHWVVPSEIAKGVSLAYSNKFATNGKRSLAVTTGGGWSQVLRYGENDTDRRAVVELHKLLANNLTLNFDIRVPDNVEWVKIEIAMQGSALPWTPLTGNAMLPGQHTQRFIIPPKIQAEIQKCDNWFQIILIVNTSGPTTVYIDNICVE